MGGVTGKVGGEKVYSEQRVAWAAAGAMAAYHVLWHVADYGFHNVCLRWCLCDSGFLLLLGNSFHLGYRSRLPKILHTVTVACPSPLAFLVRQSNRFPRSPAPLWFAGWPSDQLWFLVFGVDRKHVCVHVGEISTQAAGRHEGSTPCARLMEKMDYASFTFRSSHQ